MPASEPDQAHLMMVGVPAMVFENYMKLVLPGVVLP